MEVFYLFEEIAVLVFIIGWSCGAYKLWRMNEND
jgi:hypothetical protein